MYRGKYTEAKTPEAFAAFLRGLSDDAKRLASDHGADEVNSTTTRFLEAAAAYVEDLNRLGLFNDAHADRWQGMVGVLSAALIYPTDDQDSDHDQV